ncbi:hypothetical protein ACE1TF_07930 [Geomicrobium sp. JSM 1781026]|uniref:hypothetical protein n=1 Tax=Geomicrobium sp. JSM 1781026 TaxID=3344580 RepID=UPI0035C16017
MKKFLFISILAIIMAVPSVSLADTFSNSRIDGGQVHAYFNGSVSNYGYTNIYQQSLESWNGISSVVSVTRTHSSSAHPYYDRYNVSGARPSGSGGGLLLGTINAFNISGNQTTHHSPWGHATVTLYHNNIINVLNTSYFQRNVAIHEIGHTLKMAHPESQSGFNYMPLNGQTSIMTQTGDRPSQATAPHNYDRSELRRKWGN